MNLNIKINEFSQAEKATTIENNFGKNEQVLVTGAAGFIGSHLTERLVKSGKRVRALIHYDSRQEQNNLELIPGEIRKEIEVIAGDICDAGFMNHAVKGCETVYHLAALISIPYSYSAPAIYMQTNAMGTLYLAAACITNGVNRLVHTSTSECYGSALTVPIDENHPLQAQSPYAASKISADKIIESYHKSFDLQAVTVRPFNTYGPRQSTRAAIPTIISQLIQGVNELQLGALDPTRDFLYVSDTVEGYLAAGESDASVSVGEVFNLATGNEISIGDLAKKIMRILEIDIPIISEEQRLRPTKSEVNRLCGNPQKAKNKLGWSAKVGLDDGIRSVIQFIKENPDLFNKLNYRK